MLQIEAKKYRAILGDGALQVVARRAGDRTGTGYPVRNVPPENPTGPRREIYVYQVPGTGSASQSYVGQPAGAV